MILKMTKIKKIEELIYFDGQWNFPEYNLEEYLGIDIKSYQEMIKISKYILKGNKEIKSNFYEKINIIEK